MTLESWLTQATRRLAASAVAQVRTEITEHFEAARDAAIAAGVTDAEAGRHALTALGDPRAANCQYRRVLLTADEARLLREGNWEARFVCTHAWIKPVAIIGYLILLVTAAVFALSGHAVYATYALLAAFGMSPFIGAVFLRINTPTRGLIFRIAKWIAVGTPCLLIFEHNTRQYSWLLFCCLSPIAMAEITRASIRRKLPVESWPRHLYL